MAGFLSNILHVFLVKDQLKTERVFQVYLVDYRCAVEGGSQKDKIVFVNNGEGDVLPALSYTFEFAEDSVFVGFLVNFAFRFSRFYSVLHRQVGDFYRCPTPPGLQVR